MEVVDGSLIDIDALFSEHQMYANIMGTCTKPIIATSVVTAGPNYKFLEFRGDNDQSDRSIIAFSFYRSQ